MNIAINQRFTPAYDFSCVDGPDGGIPALPPKDKRAELPEQISRIVSEEEQEQRRELSYKFERQLVYCIKNGLSEQLEKLVWEGFFGIVGTVAPDSMRQIRNLLLTMVVICSRAAMEGGFHRCFRIRTAMFTSHASKWRRISTR